jgi:alpha-ketoglutarate-dependent taurine dioxygenase
VVPLDEARAWLHALTRRAVEPSLVYAHAWAPRDVVLWDNFGVWHSATGGLRESDRRVMHLHAYDGSAAPDLLPSGRRG